MGNWVWNNVTNWFHHYCKPQHRLNCFIITIPIYSNKVGHTTFAVRLVSYRQLPFYNVSSTVWVAKNNRVRKLAVTCLNRQPKIDLFFDIVRRIWLSLVINTHILVMSSSSKTLKVHILSENFRGWVKFPLSMNERRTKVQDDNYLWHSNDILGPVYPSMHPASIVSYRPQLRLVFHFSKVSAFIVSKLDFSWDPVTELSLSSHRNSRKMIDESIGFSWSDILNFFSCWYPDRLR